MKEEARAYERAGYSLKCPICDHDRFWTKKAQLNTKVASLFDLDWINPSGDCYICEHCRHILWFYGEGKRP